jgi:hypothetical protein
MYASLLHAHSLLRWLVLASALTALVVLAQAWRQRTFTSAHRAVMLIYVASLDFMLLLGLGLYMTSPLVHAGLANMGLAMKVPELRRFVVEHPFTMVIAIALAHVGNAKAKKAPLARRGRVAFVYVAVSLVAILLGMPWNRL